MALTLSLMYCGSHSWKAINTGKQRSGKGSQGIKPQQRRCVSNITTVGVSVWERDWTTAEFTKPQQRQTDFSLTFCYGTVYISNVAAKPTNTTNT